MPTEERLSELQHEAEEVLSCLDDAIGEPAFRLAVAMLVIAEDWNRWRNHAEILVTSASRAHGEDC